MTFEEGMKLLGEITQKMKTEQSLDEAMRLYKEACQLGERLHQMLDEAELAVREWGEEGRETDA